jgi:RecJ-like exonuclease
MVTKKQVESLQKDALKVSKLILEYVEEDAVIHVTSHLDADGLAAAGIIGKSLKKLGGLFRIRIERWIDERVVNELVAEKPSLTIFTDLGSGYLDLLSKKLSNLPIIILDHHQIVGKLPQTFIQVNPHIHEIDGSRDISGSGVAYLVAKALDETNKNLAHLAVVGALGDLQDKYAKRGLGGVNKNIVEDAVNTGYLTLETDLLLFGRETRPIHKALAYTMNPFIPDISGQEDKSLAFLINLKIKPKQEDKWRTLRDLSEKEKQELFSALASHLASKAFSSDVALTLIGNVYTLTREEPWTALRNAREFASLLNATGRMGKPSLGVALCMGERGEALKQVNAVLEENRRTIAQCLNWLTEKPNRIQELNSIYVVRGDNFIDEKVISAIASILSTNLPKPEKPLFAFSVIPIENAAKISARASVRLVNKGLNLGDILRVASEKFSGRGGGHNIAAGAQVPIEHIESFLSFVDKLVTDKLRELTQ